MGIERAVWWPWAALSLMALSLVVVPFGDAAAEPSASRGRGSWCPADMQSVFGRYCVDRYEAYTVEILPGGALRSQSPFESVEGKRVKALNRRGRMPQAYISRDEAEQACQNAGKRLCTNEEWVEACKGKRPTTWPYGEDWQPGRCNDQGISSFNMLFGHDGKQALESDYSWDNLNDPRLNRPKGTCAPSGRFGRCRNSFQLYDMVGNLHEWTSSPTGTFRGGYYLDVHKHGDGCDYKTTAHNTRYHDYSTGFRCCRDAGAARAVAKARESGKAKGGKSKGDTPKGDKAVKPKGDKPKGDKPKGDKAGGAKGDKAAKPKGDRSKGGRPKAAKPKGGKAKAAKPKGGQR